MLVELIQEFEIFFYHLFECALVSKAAVLVTMYAVFCIESIGIVGAKVFNALKWHRTALAHILLRLPKQFIDGYVKLARDKLERLGVWSGLTRLPARDRLASYKQLICQLFLRKPACFAKLGEHFFGVQGNLPLSVDKYCCRTILNLI